MRLMIIQASQGGVSENLESVKAHREWCDEILMNCDGCEWKEIQYYPSDVSMCEWVWVRVIGPPREYKRTRNAC